MDEKKARTLVVAGVSGLAWMLRDRFLERAMGIEPTALAWEARVLPLYDARFGVSARILAYTEPLSTIKPVLLCARYAPQIRLSS